MAPTQNEKGKVHPSVCAEFIRTCSVELSREQEGFVVNDLALKA